MEEEGLWWGSHEYIVHLIEVVINQDSGKPHQYTSLRELRLIFIPTSYIFYTLPLPSFSSSSFSSSFFSFLLLLLLLFPPSPLSPSPPPMLFMSFLIHICFLIALCFRLSQFLCFSSKLTCLLYLRFFVYRFLAGMWLFFSFHVCLLVVSLSLDISVFNIVSYVL